MATTASAGHALRGIGWREAGTSHSTIAPKIIRPQAITPGWNESSPMAIQRNDDPQISDVNSSRLQSPRSKLPVFVPSEVNRLVCADTVAAYRPAAGQSASNRSDESSPRFLHLCP